jgi:ketosteroid isomerase-like protein
MEGAKPTEVIAAFERYAAAFSALDPRAVVEHLNQPALMISPQGIVALAGSAQVEQFYTRVMAELPDLGYASSAFEGLTEHLLGEDLAIVTGVGIWKRADGGELRRFGMTYTWARSGGIWRIAVAAVHAPAVGQRAIWR